MQKWLFDWGLTDGLVHVPAGDKVGKDNGTHFDRDVYLNVGRNFDQESPSKMNGSLRRCAPKVMRNTRSSVTMPYMIDGQCLESA